MAAPVAVPAATEFWAGLVCNDEVKGNFARIRDVPLNANVEAFAESVMAAIDANTWGNAFAHVTAGLMFVYGPWPSADDVPEDVAGATHGRGRAPNVLLSALYDGPASDLFFLVRVPAPPSGAPLRVRVRVQAAE